MIILHQATVECAHCPRKFHQIDSTEERALQIVRDAIARHLRESHPEVAS